MLGAAGPELARSAHSWMAEVHWYMLWTSMEPAGGVMNRLRRGRSSDSDSRSSDSDGRSLRIAGPEHHAGPRRSTAPRGVRRESPPGHGWTGLRAEAYGGPGRAGLPSKMYRWRLVTQLCQQPTVTAIFRSRL